MRAGLAGGGARNQDSMPWVAISEPWYRSFFARIEPDAVLVSGLNETTGVKRPMHRRPMPYLGFAALLAAGGGLSACAMAPMAPAPSPTSYTARLDGATEVPPHNVPGQGTFVANYNPASHMLSYSLSYGGLTGPATAAHLHGPAAAGQNAPVVVPLANPIMSPMTGTATLTDPQAAMLQAGMMYANVHTAANPGGEIRGQVMPSK